MTAGSAIRRIFLAAFLLAALYILVDYLFLGRGYGRDLTLPDPVLTPGVVREELTIEVICNTLWGRDARKVTPRMKREVMASYQFSADLCESGRIEIDHLISRELGGADDVKNLWPQCYETGKDDPSFGAHKKDRLENRLHREVCAGNLMLDEAQTEIRKDWTSTYTRYFGEPRQ